MYNTAFYSEKRQSVSPAVRQAPRARSGNVRAEIWLIDGQNNAFYPVSVTRLLHGQYFKN